MFAPARPLPEWLRRALPHDRVEGSVRGHRMTAVDHGPRGALAVLMVHGNPTWSYLWRKVICELEGEPLRLIAPDLLGFGTSDKPVRPSDHQLAMHVDHVASLLDALGVERFIAVGQDWGGPIAMGTAARCADRVRGIVAGNTAILRPERPFRPKAFHRFSHAPLVSDLAFRGALFPVPILDRVQGDRRSIGWREKAAYAWPFASPLARAGALGLARMVPDREEHPTTAVIDRIGAWVERFEGPAALVWGTRDPILGRGLRRHREALSQASVRECDAGHFTQEEVPELWAAAIREVAAAAR